MPGWQGSNRKSRLPKDWPQTRKRILARDGYRCTWRADGVRCSEKASDVDHIERGDNHDDSNLRSLCGPHHRRKSSSEGGSAYRRPSRYNVKRPAAQHPGLIRR
ncbi:HNH endonuclease [Agromyces sp. NPDC127015]|uniref:HNH endonuclease n=1 Tax=Agromyces sp. NPDC127015 TaxID=3347108 RepID=UPI003646026A